MHNDEDYIASGVLEVYAAGGLTPAEQEEVEKRAATSPAIRAALDEACTAMAAYAQQHAVQPRPALRQKVLAQFETGFQAINTPVSQAEDTPSRPFVYSEEKEASPYKWMLAASITLFLLSGFLSYHFYTKWQQAEEKLALAVASEQRLASNFEAVSLQVQEQQEALAVLRNPEFKQVQLQGLESNPTAHMLVYWNQASQQVYIDLVNLPAPPPDKQYQLWALHNGTPIDAGMISHMGKEAQIQQMKNIGAAQAFAVTLEPVGGSPSPTLENLTVMGEIKS
ncbi:anti-sigma factor domain-containing protein [Pontibacter sp. SGAir0037]|uniref:anti-sigma factor n=1 Tax=Pontibacter sp. SGAir0037 TaxID=2571030 RepID=UPI0010CCF655|nr:anti-sigma factor [Pontibacter sp. SGAir0037]QCR24694.1 hypothetical protein C1N53_21620 [Pontibacter sp. SGAir0037]